MAPKKKKSLFYYCFPCIKKSEEDPDEVMLKNFGKDFTEYEFVIENLAIRRAPKILLDQYQPPPKIKHTQTKKPKVKDFGTSVTKETFTCDVVGPVVKVGESGDSLECCSRGFPKCSDKTKEDVLKKILIPPCHVFRIEHPAPRLQKVSADIHKTGDGGVIPKRNLSIPSEIQQTIDALKVAKPPINSSSPKRNKRTLLRSISDTSCDKETCCNILGSENIKQENEPELKSPIVDVFSTQIRRKNISKFPQVRKRSSSPKILEPKKIYEQAGDQDTQKDVLDTAVDAEQSSNLKWKIVINKHTDTTSESDKKY